VPRSVGNTRLVRVGRADLGKPVVSALVML
jgi:hypothetical protein